MHRQTLAVLIPVMMMFFTGLIAFSATRLGRAVAKRIEGGGSADLEARIAQLEAEQDRLARELAEAQERLDFTERALAREKQRAHLPGI
ncbi:MAG: hypothetical protein HUU26_04100 [Gemmatimonadaceae bacterium]|nr:hypothetical protein [Gemmatimonadaceae bacterium]